MRGLFCRLVPAVVAAAALGSAPAARADVVLTFLDTTPSRDLYMHADYIPYAPIPAGGMLFGVGAGGPAAGLTGPTVTTFCADLFTDVGHQLPVSYSVVAVSQLPDVQNPRFGNADPAAKTAYLTELFGRYYGQTGTNDGAAAFQFDVWKLLYDPLAQKNVTQGEIRFDVPTDPAAAAAQAPVQQLAQTWLDSLSGDATQFTNNPTYAGDRLVGLQAAGYQNQIGILPVPGVPAPAGLVLGLFGVAALAGRAWAGRKA